MDKLKSALLNHGEKIAAVVVGLLGLMALASASWSPNTQSPTELIDTTAAGKAQIEQNQWPEEEKKAFEEIEDVESMVRDNSKILTRADAFQIQAYNPSIIRVRAKRTAVKIFPPELPIADSLVVAIAMPPEKEDEESEDGEEGDDKKEKKEEKSEGELSEEEQIAKLIAEKYGKRAGATAGGVPGMTEDGGADGGAFASDESMEAMMQSQAGYEAGGGYGDSTELVSTYGNGMMSEKKRIRVSAAVSVRMVVDLQKQRSNFRQALHLSSDYREAQQLIKYVDLVVERRRKQGPDTWDDWERVTSEDLGEILKVSFGIDQDIVSPAVTRNTITMPLPRRAIGKWGPEEASHPRVENFELNADERKLIDKWNQRVNERLAEEEVQKPKEVEVKGFSDFVQSSTDASLLAGYGGGMEMSSAMMGGTGSESYEQTYDYDEFAQSMGDGTQLTAEQKQLLDATKATADHRLLLVRFMDFTVERGFAYQYRVRLEMKNPNFNVSIDELADPSLGAEPTLFSDWSDSTPETFVTLPHRTYLTDVDGRKGEPEKASLSIFTDTTETGTPVMGDLRSVLMGLPIAGSQNVEIVDLTTQEVAPKEVTLKTNEILAAASEVGRISSSVHPGLKSVIDATKGRPVPNQVCVIDSEGGIKLRTVGEDGRKEKLDRIFAKKLLEEYADWKKKDKAENFFGGDGEGSGDYSGGGMSMSYGSSSAGAFYGGAGMGMSMGSQPGGSSKSSRGSRRK